MPQIAAILEEMQELLIKEKLPFPDVDDFIETCQYPPLMQYLTMLLHRVKPETATAEFFKALARDVLNIDLFPEVSVKGGFIDFAIRQKEGNPILLELKPLFRVEKGQQAIYPEHLNYELHQAQIQKYLLSNEYVILTNLRTLFLFSREALIEYAPFYQGDFIPFVEDYLTYENLWDYIRRTEDRIPRKELDKVFFTDLKKWYEALQAIAIHPHDSFTKEELIVLFLNKIVFIKTLEDYGLIPFKFLEDAYLAKRKIWQPKGEKLIFDYFFHELEEWFYAFYDTELFQTKFWDFVVQDPTNLQLFRSTFERVLGFGIWQQSFGKGMIHYNYRLIDEDVFGKAYESFLAERRKDSGIYYTPQPITHYMAQKLVTQVFAEPTEEVLQAIRRDDYDHAQAVVEQMQAIKIIDPCSGSGSFLIKVLREIYSHYDRITQELDRKAQAAKEARNLDDIFIEQPAHIKALQHFVTVNGFHDARILIAKIILQHLYAVDIDERALETAKTNIWKEAIKLAPGLFNFTRLTQDIQHTLPSLELNFITGDSLVDLPREQAVQVIAQEFSAEIRQMHHLRETYLRQPFEPNGVTEIKTLKQAISARLKDELPGFPKPVCLPLEYFFAYFDPASEPLPTAEQGFDAVISNPPWETIKPVKKEFAEIGKGELDVKAFNTLFTQKLKTDRNFKAGWETYVEFYDQYRSFLRHSYAYQGTGDLNYYKVFLERDLEITKTHGIVSILVPSGIQTDSGTADLRKLMFESYTPLLLYSFENRGYQELVNGEAITIKPFPDVDNRFKFSIISVKKAPAPAQDRQFNAKFYLHHPDELMTPPIAYSQRMVKKFSPDNLSIMEFRTPKDYRLCAKIRGEHPLFQKTGMVFRREFHMTDDGRLFKKRKTRQDDLPLYEGKMIHQFHPAFSAPRFYVNEGDGRAQLVSKEISRIKKELKGQKLETDLEQEFATGRLQLDYETYRFVYRAVASSTNERSLIGTIIPKNTFTGNSVNYAINRSYELHNGTLIQHQVDYRDIVYIMALFNSLTLNYYIRNKISANLNMFYLYELPIPSPTEAQREVITHQAFSLLVRHDAAGAFDALGDAVQVTPDRDADPIQIRAALEVLIARDLYGLTAADWKYLTSTFVYGSPKSRTKQELDAIMTAAAELF
ncbi:N-6 DNA methylase [candidate division KSB3 bacterium]|uniref:site-specific DNA-methyltransferase (adenine-specific) n=1 Tax=candidate division KSB3 bacterium TaxID=2044937 RepID=A0A9D5JVK5_9BACT|nr:N-6 DNA methylase [candidate division KSB3 bacterium]MBD3324955.1 N-6 DNA methylase [candidate division KSB3 bacterium]